MNFNILHKTFSIAFNHFEENNEKNENAKKLKRETQASKQEYN